jgi:methylamine dehydrogenase light chain
MRWLDEFFERGSRQVAQRTSRRSALIGIGRFLVGAAATLPVLPFDRVANHAHAAGAGKAKRDDDTACEYWRYCAIDGWLCSCCGGSVSTCPPGTEASKVVWIGTCRSHLDGRDYLISYNDCCGVTPCGRCMCNANISERPGYRMGLHNDINWCMGNSKSTMYHCTVAAAVGIAETGKG